MKKLYSLLLLATTVSFAQQAPPFVEPFNYTAPGVLQTQPGWASLNTGDDLVIASPSLTYPGLAASTGNKVTFGGTGIDAAKDFAPVTTGTTYYSILLNVTDLTAVTSTTGGYCLGFVSTASNFGATLWIKKIDANTFNIGVNARTTAANTVFSPTAYNINTTYLVVASYTLNAGTGDDVAKLWVNPAIGGTEPAALATHTNTGGTDLTQTSRLLVRQGSATDTAMIEIDELRIATTYNDATTTTVALGVQQNEIAGLSVSPNPVNNGVFYVTTDLNAERNVAIYDMLGKQVLNTTTSDSEINVAGLNAGVYMLTITEEGKTSTKKLVIR